MNHIKSDLRSHYLKLRSKFTSQQIDNFSIEIVNRCLELNLWNKSIYHLFMASEQNNEIDTSILLSVLQGKDKQIVIPKILDHYELEHYLLADQTPLKRTRWGILEPQSGIKINSNQIDVVFVPLLIFDLQGHRIGYGKGYYDKFLARQIKGKKSILTIGLAFSFQKYKKIPTTKSDMKLDHILTEKGIF